MNPGRVSIVDAHTAGEPTRVVLAGGPPLGTGTVAEQLDVMRQHHDGFRSGVVNEPRGSDVLVGALLCPSSHPACSAGVIFFNNVGYLGMCGHGAIGVIATLAYLGRIGPGDHRLETPVGVVTARLHPDGAVTVVNVPSYRKATKVTVDVLGMAPVVGDVAWGGNWFFLADSPGSIDLDHIDPLTTHAWRLRQALHRQGHPEVDHVELFSPSRRANARNFVLCPGKAYDRSPCGTGTSAKLACLAAEGRLTEGESWVQESVIGSTFAASYRWLDRAAGVIEPSITGRASITAEATLLFEEDDPFRWGVRSASSGQDAC